MSPAPPFRRSRVVRAATSRRRLASLVLVIATLTSLTACDLLPSFAPAKQRPGWKLAFGDEFNGSSLDTRNWKAYHNTYGDGNQELACLTPRNMNVAKGTLRIAARRERVQCPNGPVRDFTSGFASSRDAGRYFPRFARFEMRAKLPHGQGLWPAFWLRHRNGASTAEVDVMEYFHSQVPGQTTGTLHLDGRYNLIKKTVPFEKPSRYPVFHTWAVEITPQGSDVKFSFFLDDRLYLSYVDTQHKWTSADPNATWDMAVNLAVGGRWTGHPDAPLGELDLLGRCAQGGRMGGCETTDIMRAEFPRRSFMDVDYVRVYVPA